MSVMFAPRAKQGWKSHECKINFFARIYVILFFDTYNSIDHTWSTRETAIYTRYIENYYNQIKTYIYDNKIIDSSYIQLTIVRLMKFKAVKK